ncbi:TPA: translation initiation factor IF-2 [Patescibacteria group bacterium]|uniref:Translation initiation factor IF-2 n=2 Tax=Bacteria division Kazan-3B-28 TaxID=1798534 RepID=A0A0G2A3P7_UNCK3|nr:MAG: translation initiation factor IF-2, translation initiation factor IF-2 [candidate division Kazan bacterium GW2011_GWA1_50_15]KKW25528.1 MAG: Translation initiation factor IF-2 [candidate division Kazan bacterium GW2011_GWC1_52_13]KKW26834.1 MAG: Translation initiation factor IF-2 [candidate division Kazan bacterium GW2011_GWB1_52_7]HAV65827.1 translation initiation factor IF-2 [Patescibacteria group bacterium]HCL47699.1 translation initiation factor IF-2 [Patescibacteria group bacterium
MTDEKKQLVLPGVLTVKELAELINVPVTTVIKQLLGNGVLATINDNLDFETAAVVADDLGFEAALEPTETMSEDSAEKPKEVAGEPRAPIVTVMGHVDHGKTSLLDYIRKTKVVEGESGGITQHIGAYQVDYNGRRITFLDTPGHEAFSTIRAQGTKVTDVAILVVAADEGIKPQTIEAIELARAAGVPLIVAITKIDKPEANVMRVEQELAAHNIVTEKWGGKDVVIGVSAKTGQGVDELLELVLLTADLAELRAPAEGLAEGVVIESKHDPKVGALATLLIQRGKLQVGDPFVVGNHFGKVKAMEDYLGKRVKQAGPAQPVLVTGFTAPPSVGEVLAAVASDKTAREIIAQRNKRATSRQMSVRTSDLARLASQIRSSQLHHINIVLKADVQGSLEAIKQQLEKIKTDKGQIRIVAEGLGNIGESDVQSAAGENGFVVGFKVAVSPSARRTAKKDDIKVLTYDIIYELTDDLTRILLDSIGPEKIETSMGRATILKIFRDARHEKILGMKVISGKAQLGNTVRFFNENKEPIGEGEIKLIKRVAEEVSEATAGDDFGFQIVTHAKVKEGDAAEFVRVDYRKVSLK